MKIKIKHFIVFIYIFVLLFCRNNEIRETPSLPVTLPKKIVFAKSGLRLRTLPDLLSKSILTIPFGSEIEILHTLEEKVYIDWKAGKWLKVKYKENIGYAFDGYLMEYKEFRQFNKIDRFVRKNSKITTITFAGKLTNMNYTVYQFDPKKVNDHCSRYMEVDCIHVIVNSDDKIIYSNINSLSLGDLDYVDEKFAYFGHGWGEGDGCIADGEFTRNIFIFDSNTILSKISSWSEECLVSCSLEIGCNGKLKKEEKVKYEVIQEGKKNYSTQQIKEYFDIAEKISIEKEKLKYKNF